MDEIEYWHDIALLRHDKYFTKWVKETGRLDHHHGFLEYLRPFLGGTMLDVGANIGTHTTFYAQHGTVMAFEPNPVAFKCLIHNCPSAMCINAAVGAAPGKIKMSELSDGNYGAMYTTPGEDIPVVTIDSFNLTQCNYIKIDCEGDEIDVLIGAKETIARHRPIMCIESNPHTLQRKGQSVNDLIAAIHNLKYTCKQRVPQDISADLLCTPT